MSDGFIDFKLTEHKHDPAITSLVHQGERRRADSRLGKKERSRKIKDRERARKRLVNRINLDLSPGLKDRLEKVAKRESVSISQLVSFLILDRLIEVETKKQGAILGDYCLPSNTPKCDWQLDVEKREKEIRQNRESPSL